ncbi:DUF2207 domain-containing protein [Leucobacter massiliensis]|uniref:DUF2207 domain-containing protein n=1 Tax=Leucobacter massiliensis TaxID=1686285 RepID=A0A2S9QRL8_9MICO|nr:DUF2207 domain-containing protein [Leucobacter massiliensis]PRI12236.1 hypothetical protein B4915_04070 [Leucobacter massiliensis]
MESRLRRRFTVLGIALAGAALTGLGLGLGVPAPAAADVSDFSYESWDVDYRIGTDAEGRAVAQVTETLTARFPDFDQNRGIVRGLPIDYEGASTDPRDFSVTDGDGDPVPFEIEREDGFVAVLTGDDRYVHGVQSYRIEYTLSDVVLARDDGTADEFNWDLVDFEHLQPIGSFSARIAFSPDLAERLNGAQRCYAGPAGTDAECEITADGGVFSVEHGPLAPREGVTVAIGLEPGSVTQPPQRVPNPVFDVVPYGVAGAAVLASGAGIVAVGAMQRRRRTGRGTVIAQYEVPDSLPPLAAAPLVGAEDRAVPAQILHLAVNGAIRIEDGEPERGLFGSKPGRPVLRLVDSERVEDPLDRRALDAIFGANAAAGATAEVPEEDEKFAERMSELGEEGKREAAERGYFTRERNRTALVLGLIGLGITAVLAVLVGFGLALRGSPAVYVGLGLGVVALVLSLMSVSRHRVFTPLGAEQREHLEGVKLFIEVAEAERMRMLQSYRGAERRTDGSVDVIHLYERLLPYAALFGLEREWSKVLEVRYAEEPGMTPTWLTGATGFAAAAGVGSTISSFTSSLDSAVSYTSSSSGGSTGGGFAGGGGGGGFSGGR